MWPCLVCPAALLAEDAEASDPNSAEVDGLAFFVEDAEDEGADDGELDPAEVEFVEDIPAEVSLSIQWVPHHSTIRWAL